MTCYPGGLLDIPVTGGAHWAPGGRGELRRAGRRLLSEPFSRRARRERQHAGLGLPLAIAGFAVTVVTVTVGVGMSLSFAGMLVGLPLLAVSSLGARQFGAASRGLAGRLLGLRVAPPPPLRPPPGPLGWLRAAVADPAAWRARAYLVLKLPVALAAATAASLTWMYGVPFLTFPLWWEIFHLLAVRGLVPGPGGGWAAAWLVIREHVWLIPVVRTWPGAVSLIPLGAVLLLAGPWATRAVTALDAALVARLLGPPVSHRVRELEQSRASLVEDSAARLRRIERDLHDGAQAQMVAVAMKLGLAREKLGGTATGITEADLERAVDLVDAAHRGAKAAIIELRDLVRGIHPPVLDHGLGTALATLAARGGVPVELLLDLPERPSAAIETIAYFCAAELLANAAKHSGARRATLEAAQVPGLLRVRVSDDGCGGARLDKRGGLAGLAERVTTVDGRIEIASPPGGPTVITIELPSRAAGRASSAPRG